MEPQTNDRTHDTLLDTGAHGLHDMARNFASQAQQKAGEQVRSTLDNTRSRAADTLHEVARTLRSTGSDDQSPTSGYMNRAGDQVQRVADYIQDSDVRRLMNDTEGFARRQPALFLGGAFALGILAARFLKSTPDGGTSVGDGRSPQYDRERPLPSYQGSDQATSRYNTMSEE